MTDTAVQQPVMRRGNKSQQCANNKKKKGFNWNWKTWKLRNKIFSIIFLLLVIASIFFYFIPAHRAKQPLSFLIVGTDTDTYREQTYQGRKPKRTDAIMVATFNPKTYNVEITSIPRDTSVDYACTIENRDIRGPINEIYEVSGRKIDCLRKSVSNFLNIPIDYYALVDLSQLQQIIDSIGGIDVEVHAKDGGFCQVTTDVSKKYCFKNGEVEHMDGEEAVTYARFRKDSEKDYGRGMRQQQVISAMLSKITSEKKFNLTTISSLMSMVKTDVPPVLLAKYYSYCQNMSSVGKMVKGEIEPSKKVLPKAAWERIFTNMGMGGEKVNKENVAKVIELIKQRPEFNAAPLQLFFTNHQFFNDTQAGFYVTPEDQRYSISNALRKNLGLKEETPPEYKNQFGRFDLPTDEEAFLGDEPDYSNIPDENAKPEEQAKNKQDQKDQQSVNNKPIITGQDKYQINVGETFTPQLSANDPEDGPCQVYQVSSNLNNQVPGNYQVVYEAKDKEGNVSDRYIVYVTVVADNKPQQEKIFTDSQGRKILKDKNGNCYVITTDEHNNITSKEPLGECPVA